MRPHAVAGILSTNKSCRLRVDGVGFAVAPEMAALGPLYLHHRDPGGLQVPDSPAT